MAKNLAYAECPIMKFHYQNSSNNENIQNLPSQRSRTFERSPQPQVSQRIVSWWSSFITLAGTRYYRFGTLLLVTTYNIPSLYPHWIGHLGPKVDIT